MERDAAVGLVRRATGGAESLAEALTTRPGRVLRDVATETVDGAAVA